MGSSSHTVLSCVDLKFGILSYETVLKRWPIILTNIIDTIYRRNHDFSLAIAEKDPSGEDVRITQATIDEGKAIIERIGKLKYEMARDRPLE